LICLDNFVKFWTWKREAIPDPVFFNAEGNSFL
jgi:hypothetical protein